MAEGRDRINVDYIGPLEPIKSDPVSPNRMRITGLSLVIGIALAIAIPFLIAYLDNSVSDVEQAEEQLGLRGLGVVPRVDEAAIANILVAGASNKPAAKPEYHLLENFRIVRTNLIMHSQDPNLPQVVLVTSAMPQEGKTMIAANLAMSFASKGEKTILVDGDLRRGRLHRVFGAQNKPGLSDVLSKYNTIADACRPTGNENLTLMTCGKHLNWAAELLDSAGFAKIIQELRANYQRVIIDSPPVLGLSETSIMQRHADGVVMVIWANHTQVPNVKDAILALQTNGAKFSGFVLNRLDFNAFANRYKYFYYSPRYYSNYKAFEATPAATIES
jgi:polysaccharide biosynthesis transport protein